MSIDDLYQEPLAPPLYCSLCGKSQHEVRKLVRAEQVLICDGCIDLCHEIVHPAGEVLLFANALKERLDQLETWAFGRRRGGA